MIPEIMDKKTVIEMYQADFSRFLKQSVEISATIQNYKMDTKKYMDELLSRINKSDSVPLIAKTPKVPRKRPTRIKAIPENSEIEDDINDSETSTSSRAETFCLESSDVRPSRAKRGASVKAAGVIKKQSMMTLGTKLRRPSKEDNDQTLPRETTQKRLKESIAGSSEDEDAKPLKQIKLEKKKSTKNKFSVTNNGLNNSVENKRSSLKRKLEHSYEDDDNITLTLSDTRKISSPNEPLAKKPNVLNKHYGELKSQINVLERISEKSSNSAGNQDDNQRITRSSSASSIRAPYRKNIGGNVINETMDMSNPDETVASMYEDALTKPLPIMNSTMNPQSILNPAVMLEPLAPIRRIMNTTVTISKSSFRDPRSGNNTTIKEQEVMSTEKSKAVLPNTTVKLERISDAKNSKNSKLSKLNELITDDESSPERKDYKKPKETKKLTKAQKRVTRSSNNSFISDEDEEIQKTPIKKITSKNLTSSTIKSSYKSTALFSPYAKESVKKKVEAFEQVASSPNHETAGRVTRTKTRALASIAEPAPPTVTQKLARKSLAKAKKISLAKHAKDYDDTKENENIYTKTAKKKTSTASEKSHKLSQAKTTPLGKSRVLQAPSSAQKYIMNTPSNAQSLSNYSKPLTSSRGNVVCNVDSFIQSTKSASKTIDRVAEEKRRRAHEEDARRKREELLKAQADEKRRKREEKELKNKLAREAKERLEMEKRKKAEQEREEKARMMQQMQERQKEEAERKKQLQLQRAQEKEERRKQEELLRIQRLQEQEEQERQLAEQKRKEQEMEKRKYAEYKHHQEMKLKAQLEKAKAKLHAQKHLPATYKLDSDPDEEESDDESKPKHQIPMWASRNIRLTQLSMQKFVPMKNILKFFNARKCTPDLRELFTGIDPKKLKRSSSAIWKTPPRYSMMNCSIVRE